MVPSKLNNCGLGTERLRKIVTHYVDTYLLCKEEDLWRVTDREMPASRFSLGSLYQRVIGVEMRKAHSALTDSKNNAKLLLELDPKLEFTGGWMSSLNDLFDDAEN